MTKEQIFKDLRAQLSKDSVVRQNEPLARRTTLRVGGPADVFVEPAGEADLSETLQFCAELGIPVVILGRGSNLLIRDGGIRGVVVSMGHPAFCRVQFEEPLRLVCGSGAKLKDIAQEARRHSMAGLEFMEGIPGSLGGALRMNAGAMGGSTFERVVSVRFMDRAGQAQEKPVSKIPFQYRSCPLFKTHIALGAVLTGAPDSTEAIMARMKDFNEKRWAIQPREPSAGCTFKNPTTIQAGKLIDELGLKGTQVGGAVVSTLHGNFIINDGTATARDVLNLIDLVVQRARNERGIALETEIEIIGEN